MVDTTAYKARLDTLLIDITAELETLGVRNPDVPGDWIATPDTNAHNETDTNLEADKVEDSNERQAVLAELETRYNNIQRALSKIDAGTYGVCEISGEEIESDRLDANPAARTCKAHLEDESQLPL